MIQNAIPLPPKVFETDEFQKLFCVNSQGGVEFKWDQLTHYLKNCGKWIGSDEKLFLFDGLVYRYISKDKFCASIEAKLSGLIIAPKSQYSTRKAEEIYKQMWQAHLIDVPLNSDEDYIPFEDGFYNWKMKCFFPLQEKYFEFSDFYFTDTIHVKFLENSGIKGFLRILTKLISSEEDQEKVCRFFAYTLLCEPNNQRYHQIWYGNGNNGKTQLSEFWGSLLGDLCSYIGFNELLIDPHAAVGLRGKHLNVCSEISSIMMNPAALDRAKGLTANKYLPGRDIYESQKDAKSINTCRELISTNELPFSEHMANDLAFFSRWDLIYFGYVWNKNDWSEYLDEKGSSKHVFEKIFKAEASGIIRFILDFIPEVGQLEVKDTESRLKWLIASNSTVAFLHSKSVNDKGDTEKRDLYDFYVKWCERNGRSSQNYQTFFKTLKNRNYTQISKWIDEGGVKTLNYYIEGILCVDYIQNDLNKFGVK